MPSANCAQDGGRPAPAGACCLRRRGTHFSIAADTYFSITPVFDTPPGPHDWLTRTVIVGKGRRYPNPDHTIFQYFAIL